MPTERLWMNARLWKTPPGSRASRREAVLAVEPDEVGARDKAFPRVRAARAIAVGGFVTAAELMEEIDALLSRRCSDCGPRSSW